MANFLPLKNYLLYCLDRAINCFGLKPPFLDAGCGRADVSRHLANKGWPGKAVDDSSQAIKLANHLLYQFPKVSLEKKTIFAEEGIYRTIIAFDILEHLENDLQAIRKFFSILEEGGHLVVSVPVHISEWRWDDNFYGHLRRYSIKEISDKLKENGFSINAIWDFTYPVFWFMRRIYVLLKRSRIGLFDNPKDASLASATVNAWDMGFVSFLLSHFLFLWTPLYYLQFRFLRKKINRGFEVMIIAQKKKTA